MTNSVPKRDLGGSKKGRGLTPTALTQVNIQKVKGSLTSTMSVKSETKHYIRKHDATQITNADFSHILKDCQFFGDPSCTASQTGLVSKALQDLSVRGTCPFPMLIHPQPNFWTAAHTRCCDSINTLPAPACIMIRQKVDHKDRNPDQQPVRPMSETHKAERAT